MTSLQSCADTRSREPSEGCWGQTLGARVYIRNQIRLASVEFAETFRVGHQRSDLRLRAAGIALQLILISITTGGTRRSRRVRNHWWLCRSRVERERQESDSRRARIVPRSQNGF